MINLDQLRAVQALSAKNLTDKQSVSKLPAMILTNGLLAASAFATVKKESGEYRRPEMQAAIKAAAAHLGSPQIGIDILTGIATGEDLIARLTQNGGHGHPSALDLQRATTETLAFLAFLKRFASKSDDRTEGVRSGNRSTPVSSEI